VTTRERSAASVFMKSGDELVLGELTSVAIVDEQGEITVPLAGGQLEYLSGPELPVVVTARGTKIIPSAGGVYSVVLRGDALRVTATKGFAEFESANGKVKVAEGKTLLATLETAGAGSATMRSRGRIIKYVITVAAIAGGGGLGLELVRSNSGCTVSPSKTGDCASH
ncbi:MAG TPA: hypothetical protein VJN90_01995, partial [Candidatus Acidoferrales bacterium]|nr:hypothetical protein [Candidatus Acidoferrales bacterium]